MTTLQKHMQDNLNVCNDNDHKEGIKCGITSCHTPNLVLENLAIPYRPLTFQSKTVNQYPFYISSQLLFNTNTHFCKG